MYGTYIRERAYNRNINSVSRQMGLHMGLTCTTLDGGFNVGFDGMAPCTKPAPMEAIGELCS